MKLNKSQCLVCTLVCMAFISLMLTGCSFTSAQPSTNSALGVDSVTEEASSGETIAGYGTVNIDSDVTVAEDMTIQTGYGDLFFPAQWREFLVTDQTEGDNDTIEVSFSAKINGKTYSLFTITIGGDEDTPAGTLTSSDGTQRNVYVQIEEIQESNLLDESEQNRLYAMQEDINYLLDSLK